MLSAHPASVVATWSLAFEQVEQANPAATDLLRLCAYLAAEAIPEEVLLPQAPSVEEDPAEGAAARLRFHEALRTVSAYSLLRYQAEARTCLMHRLVQAVLRESMGESVGKQVVEGAVERLNAAFPEVEHGNWGQCERLVPHVLACAGHRLLQEHNHLALAAVLHKTAIYLSERGHYGQAEPLLQQALHIREQAEGAEHLDVATSLHFLGIICGEQGKYAEAELPTSGRCASGSSSLDQNTPWSRIPWTDSQASTPGSGSMARQNRSTSGPCASGSSS